MSILFIIFMPLLVYLMLHFFFRRIFYQLPYLGLEIEGYYDDDYKRLDEENKKIEYGYPNIRGFTKNEHLVSIYKKLEKLKDTEKFSRESGKFPAFGTGKMIRISGNSEKTYNLLVNLSNRLHEDDLYVFERFILDKIIEHDKQQELLTINKQ